MNYDDPRWAELRGGYRRPYDPRNALRSLEANTNVAEAWNELWHGLYHQGDVGEASYATVPELARIHAIRGVPDWNSYALAVSIEEARRCGGNPTMPPWLNEEYEVAWRQLIALALRDLQQETDARLVLSAIAAIAIGKGQLTLARMAMLTEDERKELLER